MNATKERADQDEHAGDMTVLTMGSDPDDSLMLH
ncbi:hypothetical protein PI125_g24038 [Phytophthora idaei]|nr:hypothetical protein PI125_g24038 [Phytophthora idaei]